MVKAWNKVATLFGVGHRDETDSQYLKHQTAWLERRKRLLNRRCGRLAQEVHDEPQPGLGDRCEKRDLQSHKKRRTRATPIDEPQESGKKTSTTIDNNNSASSVEQTLDPDHATITTAFVTQTTHAPTETNLDTAINHTTVHRPQYPGFPHKHVEGTLSLRSLNDFTDYNAKESIVKLVNDVLSRHQPKRVFGMGLVGYLLSRKFRKDLTSAQLNAIYSFNDHRPYFSYWVTSVQILIMIITILTYGFGTFGFNKTIVKKNILVSSLIPKTESYLESDNIWVGPRPQDLIHLGAKFTPCMRRDSLIYEEILKDREEEKYTGCCMRRNECLQRTKETCSESSIWLSWNDTAGGNSNGAPQIVSTKALRKSGAVCGQDPRYCQRPASNYPHEWPDDITQWPICHEPLSTNEPNHHMSCKITGHPCCFGIYGQCRIISSDHCQFIRGTFHPEATLCSQVSCMEDVCGMVPFYAREYPDQFYRLFTALFLHAGLLHLTFTVILQYYIMRDIERLLGSTRMAIIYILPGVAGYLASATFVPYHTQVGPSGSQFALLACLMAETINSWKLLDNPMSSLWKLISIAIGLFILGLLPWIDNYAHIFGFLVGLMLSLALTPYLTPFNDAYSRRNKVIQIWVCIILVILTFVLLPLPLYVFPLYKCSWCQYLDCWPLAPHWCENQDIKVTRLDIF